MSSMKDSIDLYIGDSLVIDTSLSNILKNLYKTPVLFPKVICPFSEFLDVNLSKSSFELILLILLITNS